MTGPLPSTEPDLVAAILSGDARLSRNRAFALMSSEIGRRARRRAGFLRSLARDIERMRATNGAVELEQGRFARGTVRVVVHAVDMVRRAYLTDDEVQLLVRAFPVVAGVFDVGAAV